MTNLNWNSLYAIWYQHISRSSYFIFFLALNLIIILIWASGHLFATLYFRTLVYMWTSHYIKLWLCCLCLHFSVRKAFDSDWKDDYPITVFMNGVVLWHFRGNFLSSCDLNMFKFPFDSQVCYITFGNIVDVDDIINITNLMDHIDLTFFIENQEFRYANHLRI